MDNPTGRVLSLVDSPDGVRAVVAVAEAPVCPRCAAGKGCGAGLLATPQGEHNIEVNVPPGMAVAINDDVEVSLAPDNILRAALIVYGMPLSGALAGAALAYAAGFGDEGAVGAALLGLGAGLAIGRYRLRQADCLRRFTPVIEKRI
jgi:positive regulator of sigma E activity